MRARRRSALRRRQRRPLSRIDPVVAVASPPVLLAHPTFAKQTRGGLDRSRPDGLQVSLVAHHNYPVADGEEGIALRADLQLAGWALEAEHNDRSQRVQDIVNGLAAKA